MAKLLYVAGEECKNLPGVIRKIDSQIMFFNNSGINTDLIFLKQNKRIRKIFPLSSSHDFSISLTAEWDYLYIRWMPMNYPALSFLNKFRSKNVGAKVILEIPTYPYADELSKFSNILTIYRDKFYRNFLRKYINIIAVYTDFEEVFNIPTLKLVNPIVVDNINVPLRNAYRADNVVNIIAVASVEYYYGYDRLIKGLKNYYDNFPKYDVHFHLVGDGGALLELKQLSSMLKLTELQVTFYGFRIDKELDEIYELADIGIDVLGCHRKDDFYFGTLKSREYMCKGLPFITEYPLPESISGIKNYILKVPADESDIDVNAIVDFFLETKKESRETTVKNMRNFAYSYCDISVAMNPVIEYMEG